MTTSNQQQLILSLIESTSLWPNFGQVYIATLSSEFTLFLAIFALTFKTAKTSVMLNSLKKYASFFLYTNLAFLAYSIFFLSTANQVLLFAGSFKITVFTQTIKILLTLVSIFFISFSTKTLKTIANFSEFYLLFIILNLFASVLVSCNNFVLLLLTLEGLSLTLYILATLERSYGGITAAVKYFTFGTLGSLLLFWGVVHLYTLVPSLSFNVLFTLFECTQSSTLEFSSALILVGFLLKLGAAPLHQWVADVYTGTHIFVTAIFATFVKLLLFILFFQIAYYLNSTVLIDFVIISSLVVGCYFTLLQSEIKRFLAYGSILHVGFILMGDLNSSLVYLFTYVASSLIFFSVLITLRVYTNKELVYFNDLRFIRGAGYFNITLLVLSLSSSAGLPPFAGFYGKYLVWVSLIEDIYLYNNQFSYIVLVTSIVLSLITIFYYMRIIIYLFIDTDIQNGSIVVFTNLVTQTFQISLAFIILCWTYLQSTVLSHSGTLGQFIF